jgi:hypothetical protein
MFFFTLFLALQIFRLSLERMNLSPWFFLSLATILGISLALWMLRQFFLWLISPAMLGPVWESFICPQLPVFVPQRIFVYANFPWAPLMFCVVLPFSLFIWGLTRKWFREASLDLPAIFREVLLPWFQDHGAWLFLLPCLAFPIYVLISPLWELFRELRRLRQEHMYWLMIWAYGFRPFQNLLVQFQESFLEWALFNLEVQGAPYVFLRVPYGLVFYTGRLGRFHGLLGLGELLLRGGKLELWFAVAPYVAVIYGLSVLFYYGTLESTDRGRAYHQRLYGTLRPPLTEKELCFTWLLPGEKKEAYY